MSQKSSLIEFISKHALLFTRKINKMDHYSPDASFAFLYIMPYPPENEIQSGSWHPAGLHSYAGILKIAATTSGPLLTTSSNQAHHGLSLMMLSSEQCLQCTYIKVMQLVTCHTGKAMKSFYGSKL